MEIIFKLLDKKQEIPFDLLLLADPSRDLVEEYVRRGYCYLAFRENELVGEFVLIHTHAQTIEIVNIAVREEYQGQGIGQALVMRGIEEAKKLKAKIIEIGTGNSSMNQLKLYQRCGFRIFGIDTDFFIRNYDEEIYEDGIQCKDMIRLRMEL